MRDPEQPGELSRSAQMALRRVTAGMVATARIRTEAELLSLLAGSDGPDEVDPEELLDLASRVAALEEPWTAALTLLREENVNEGNRGRAESSTSLGESYDDGTEPRDSVAVVEEACELIERCLGDMAQALGVPPGFTGEVPGLGTD